MRSRHSYLMMFIVALIFGLIVTMQLPQMAQAEVVQATMSANDPTLETIFTGKIAFVKKDNDHSQIYTMNTDGTGLTHLSHDATIDDYGPTWSPDGSKIAFTSFRPNGTPNQLGLYVMNADGTNEQLLYKGLGEDGATYDVGWSPNSQQLAIVPRFSQQLYIVGVNNPTAVEMITLQQEIHEPAWSPDGKYLVFLSDTWYSLDQIDLDSSHHIILIPGNTDEHFFCPTWSPDGTSIAFRHGALGTYRTDVMDATLRTVQSMGYDADDYGEVQSTCPKWTLDGQYLLFSSNRGDHQGEKYGSKFDLYVVSVKAPYRLIRLTYNQQFPVDFSWFPGAKSNLPPTARAEVAQATMSANDPTLETIFTGKIAFAKKDNDHSQIYTMNTDGTGLTRLSHDATIDDYGPVWSPDGSKIAFTSFRPDGASNQLGLYVMNADGTNEQLLYKGLGEDGATYDVGWAPNSQQLAIVPRAIA